LPYVDLWQNYPCLESIINKNKYEPLSEAERHHDRSLLDEIHNLGLP